MQGKLADMYVRLQSARAFSYRVAKALEDGHGSRMDAAACLLYASESAVQVSLEAIQSLGGNGYINEYRPAGCCATRSSTTSVRAPTRSAGC